MTDQPESQPSPQAPARRRLVTAAPAAQPKVKFVSPAAEGVEVAKPRFLTPELQAKLAREQEEAARRAAEQAEADRIAAEKAAAEEEAARIATEKEAARMAAEKEAARIKAEQEAVEAARVAAEKEAARIAAEEERARLAAEQAKQEEASRPLADSSVDAQIQDALAKVAEAQKALAEAQAVALAQAAGVAKPAMEAPEPQEPAPVPAAGSIPKLKVLKSPLGSPPAPSTVAAPSSGPVPAASAAPSPGTPLAGAGGIQPPAGGENAREMAASVDKSKSLLRGIIYGVCALVLVAGGVGIYAWQTNAKKDRVEGENAQLNKLVMEGAKLGRSRLFDSKSLGRVPDVKVVPNEEDAALLLDNVRGVKGHRDNWPGAAHLVSIMAQMDDNIARQVVGDMKKNVRDYSKEKYAMMVTLLAKSSSPVMRELLKDLYASISDSKNKKVQDKQAVVLQYMRFSMKLDDLDDVMKILQQKNVSSDLVSSAFRTARYLIDEAPEAKRVGLSSKLLQYQQGMPEENLKILYRLLARTGDPKVLDMMEKSYKEDPKKALVIVTAWGDWNTDDAVPYLFRAWKDESLHSRVRSQAHDSILRVLSVDRDRDDNATIKLFEPLIADAKTSDRRRFLVSAFKRLSNRPYVIRLLGRIKQAAEENSNKLDSRLRAAEEALVKAEAKYKNSPDDAAAKADYEAKNNAANDLANEKAGEDNVIADVEKALEKIKKTPAPVKRAGKAKDDDDESSVIKTM